MGSVPGRLDLEAPGDLPERLDELDPPDDIHASATYRRWLAERLGARVLEAAWS
jgi:CO/xanthine dehydrogenase FAD-binding subunit